MFSLKKNLAELTALIREKEKIQVLTTSLAFKQLVAISFLNEIFQEKSFLKKLIFLCSCEKEARKLSDFFSFYAKNESFEVKELLSTPYWDLLKTYEHENRRFQSLEALDFLKDCSRAGVVVATPDGFMQKIFHDSAYEEASFTLSVLQEQDPFELEETLKKLGYKWRV